MCVCVRVRERERDPSTDDGFARSFNPTIISKEREILRGDKKTREKGGRERGRKKKRRRRGTL